MVKTDETNNIPLLETKGLTKKFGSFIANDKIDFSVNAGEIHSILGENGAGKSTLMKSLYGVHAPEEGEVLINGHREELHPPAKARTHGISMVFQDFRIIPSLTVLENIALAYSEKGFFLKKKKLREKIETVTKRYNLSINPDSYVWELDLGERQRVEIIKVLVEDMTKIIIFDEPTSVLTPSEVDAFLKMLKMLREDGYGIILITHKIREVLACSNKVTILREGKVVYSRSINEQTTEEELVSEMIGSTDIPQANQSQKYKGIQKELLRVEGMTVEDDRGQEILSQINLSLKAGEIIGVAGVSGNGQKEIVEALFGVRKVKAGKIIVKEEDFTGKSAKAFLDAGISYIPEDPLHDQIVPGLSIYDHMVLSGMPVEKKNVGIDWDKVKAKFDQSEVVKELRVAEGNRIADTLSGGNVQRMVLARALLSEPDIVLVSYPSRGLDIATVNSIHNMFRKLKEEGVGILVISEDLTEVFEISDQIVVLGQTNLYGPYSPNDTTSYEIGKVMLEGEAS
ncbi:ABC transporter ATP-binding protein [Gracilibacillus oryzae]|uniref:ABC transporter ATP-binding protein n=1 Tax=Gracilibacillus oryzae TaxID=1672701 RepID=UPI001886491F|nr:ABC transporter ATP-binding protein [Gracilibacillus oryzae]